MNSFKRKGKPAESRGRKTKGPENGSQLPKGSFLFAWRKFDKYRQMADLKLFKPWDKN